MIHHYRNIPRVPYIFSLGQTSKFQSGKALRPKKQLTHSNFLGISTSASTYVLIYNKLSRNSGEQFGRSCKKIQGNCEIMLPQINMYPRSLRSLNPFPILKVKVQKKKFKTVNRIGVKSIGTVGGP